jgi:hypothetical protein
MEKLQFDKVPFTKKGAKTSMNKLISSGSWNKKQGSGRIYHCPICKWWHITSKLDTEPIESYKEFVEVNLKHKNEFLKLMSNNG